MKTKLEIEETKREVKIGFTTWELFEVNGRYYIRNKRARWSQCWGFDSEESREGILDDYRKEAERKAELRRARNAEKKAAKDAAFANGNPYKVGDIMVNSWGYEQTNIDYYIVTKVGRRSVTIQAIGKKMVPSEGFAPMSGHCVPDPDNILTNEKPMVKILQNYGGDKLYVPMRFGAMSKWEGKPNYVSWYA